MDGVSTRGLVGLKFQESVFLGAEQDFIKGPETMGTLVESRISAFESLLDHRSPDRFLSLIHI